ncbi:odorant receptor 9a [Solenopsis invicta]|uniref:odorant receptor 9a n=1 Tax=Solenopsis invicta TaxID=13686 RepID=UPI000E33D969|nr:odorant receptor 9a [Solenopsis invicta]
MLVNILREHNINKRFLWWLGLWPFQYKLMRCWLPMLLFAIQITYLPFEIVTLYMHRHNGQIIFESLYQIVVSLAFITKLLNQLWNRDKFRRLYEIMEDHWNIFTNEMDVRILKNYSHISHKFTILYSTLTYTMMSLFIMIPSLGPMFLDIVLPLNKSRPRNIALYSEYGIDRDKYFFPIFLHTSIVIIFGVSIMVAVDSMHIVCTAHACSLFQIIGRQIENIISNMNTDNKMNKLERYPNEEYKILNEKIIYREYITCIKKHQLTLEYVIVLNDTHKIVGFSFLFLIGVCFSLLGIRIVYVLDQIEEMIRFMCIITGALLQLMIVCYSGQKLMDESQNIFHRAYAAEWYNFSPRLKSLLIIILHKSIVPCKLTAGNLFPLSMAVFAAVIRTGISYFTAFLSIKN